MIKQVDKVNSKANDAAGEVFEAIHDLMHLYRGRRQRELHEDTTGLTHMEFKALGYFGRHAGATQTDLVTHSGRDKAQIARLIAGLKAKGLLTATADVQDRRAQRLALSDAGQALHRQLRRQGEQLSQAAVQGLADAEVAELLTLLARLRANLEAAD